AALAEPALIVLDELHQLTNHVCLEVLATLLAHVPAETQVVLSTRGKLGLPPPALQGGRVLELGRDDLRLSDAEALALVAAAGLDLDEEEVTSLNESSEGGPAGMYLMPLAVRRSGGLPKMSLVGTDRYIVDYLRLELLDRL